MIYGSLHIDQVTTEQELIDCLTSSAVECFLLGGTTIVLTRGRLLPNIGHDVTIWGEANTTLDLSYADGLLEVPDGVHVTIRDLEIKNGRAATGALVTSMGSSTFEVRNVVLRNMLAIVGGIIHASHASVSSGRSAIISNVQFHNCSTGGVPPLIYIEDPLNALIEDVTFENCTNDGQGLTPQLVSIFSNARDSVVTVGGAMKFIGDEDTAARDQEAIVAIGTFNNPRSITVLSNTSKPAQWYFTNYYRPIELAARTAPVQFEAYSLVVENATLRESVESMPFHALSLAGDYLVNVSVTTITVQDLGVMNTLPNSAGATLKVGDLSSINCRTGAAFLLESPTNVTSTISITIQDPFHSGVKTLAEVNFDVATFEIFRTNPNVTQGSALVALQPTSVHNSDTFYIHDFKTNGDGAALWTNSQLNISGRSFVAEGNVAEGSGAGAYVESGQLTIHTTWQILFSANEAAQGGALALGTAGIELSCLAPGGVSFESNKASMQGGALLIHPTHQSAFASLSFQGNSAPSGCVVAFTTGCQRFDAAINYGSNILTVPQGTSACVVNEYMCGTYSAPPPSPVAIANPVQDSSSTCAGSPPAADTWTCQNGHWTSDGPITVPGSLTVPADSQLVVVGDLTVPENLVFTGLRGSVTVQGGCTIINGVVQIDITSKDLEEISKDPASMRALTLLAQNTTCTSLASVGVSTNKIEKTCRKVKSASSEDQNEGGKTSLVVVLQVDSSSCNTKWIVLGCVLGGILVIVVIAILLVTFNSKAKTLVRPFWARKKATALH